MSESEHSADSSAPLSPDNEGPPQGLREYVGVIWIGDEPGIRLRVLAYSGKGARASVIHQYGEGHVISLWNEDDAARPR